ncbi:MAG: hypothetical protein IJX76_08850 [Clostridia bacterium]|nr:hypothetical protein [Clostridia bacterium]
MSNKANKRSMLVCAITLLLCVSMVVGSTYAWFTDAVAVNDNIIASGELKVELDYWDEATGTWVMADHPIFNYDKWEPGYTEVKYVKVTNAGDLAFKYEFDFDFQDRQLLKKDAPNLSDVLDIYYGVANVGDIATRSDLSKLTKVNGSLSDVMIANGKFAPGVLKADEEVVLCIALKMQESAGNEYQNLKVGNTKFDLKLYAEQWTSESDSFGPDYDDTFTGLTAKVTTDGALAVPSNEWSSLSLASPDKLDSTYTFSAVETAEQAEAGKYANWIADFVVKVDRPIAQTSDFGIAGNYGSWGWIGFDPAAIGMAIPADTEFRLLYDYTQGAIGINYYELCNTVKNFRCGVWNNDPANCGTTMTVELRIYETQERTEENNSTNIETGKSYTLASITYTLGLSTPDAVASALATGANVVLSADVDMGDTQITIPAGVSSTLDLNGYDLTGAYTGADHYAMFTVANGASLTVTGEGEVSAETEVTADNRSLAIFQNAGELTLNGGTYNLNNTRNGHTWIIATIVDNRTNSASCATKLTINGGDYTVSGDATNLFRNYPQQGGTATLEINDGVFHANTGKSTTYIWNQESGSNVGELYFNGGIYEDGVVYEDYNGQSDVHIAAGVTIQGYSGNT